MADNNEQTPPSQAPIKKRGRKLAEDEDHVDKRRTQIRLAQRNFRERKETRIRELEQQVAALLSAACAACAEKAARIAATQGADSPLADVSAPVSAQLRLAASAEAHPATTAMRFGLPAVERGCCALKRLPSLKECTHVDELFELLMKLSHCPISDRKTIRKHLMEMIWVKYKLFDQCLTVDKEELTKAVHIIESVHEENANHLTFLYELASGQSPTEVLLHFARLGTVRNPVSLSEKSLSFIEANERSQMLRQSSVFLDAVKQIPSLSKHSALVEEQCILFWIQAKTEDKEQREDLFFKMLQVSNSLLDLCATTEDRVLFILATELGRQSDVQKSDNLFNV